MLYNVILIQPGTVSRCCSVCFQSFRVLMTKVNTICTELNMMQLCVC